LCQIVFGGIFAEIFLTFIMIFGGYLIINISSDPHFNLSPQKALVSLLIGNIIMAVEGIYFVIFRKKIGFFFECLLFYDELIIEAEVDKAAIEYSKPVETVIISFIKDKLMHAESASSIFYLCKGKIGTPHNILASPTPSGKLFKMKVLHKKFISFSSRKPNIDDINSMINVQNQKAGNTQVTIDCVICFDRKIDSFFMPCGHSGSCHECALSLLKSTAICHLCRSVY
jgi:Zinc finger, C3HC4 type (RING finger)